eukprot:6474485-Amphidinium_carterae.3
MAINSMSGGAVHMWSCTGHSKSRPGQCLAEQAQPFSRLPHNITMVKTICYQNACWACVAPALLYYPRF